MNKIWLVIKREYLSRVLKKTFVLTTLLTPLFFAGLFGFVIFMTVKNVSQEKIAVVDPTGQLKGGLESSKSVTYEFPNNVDTSNFIAKGYSAILYPPQTGLNTTNNFRVISKKSLNTVANTKIERDISKTLENNMISQELNIDPKKLDSIKDRASTVTVISSKKGEDGELKQSNFGVANGIGYVTGFLIYITLIIYGAMVMRGVMEEKTNRIAEVIISSVKPFQLMVGKILGIGAVGLTQFLLWIVLIAILLGIMTSLIPSEVMQQVQDSQDQIPGASQQGSEAVRSLAEVQANLSTVNWPLIIFCFLFYFFGGYLFYAALFAAIGSAVNEDAQDAQSLMFPVTLPIIVAIIIMINAINDPGGSLATWSSIVPFFSPVVMMARIPFGVPDTVSYLELISSMVFLVLGFLLTTWLSAKIYRTGILMYGKKPSWKEMAKWIVR